MRETDAERQQREERISRELRDIAERERDRINREERERIEQEKRKKGNG